MTPTQCYIFPDVVGRQRLQSSSKSHRRATEPQTSRPHSFDVLVGFSLTHFGRQASLSTLAEKACCNISNLFHRFARLCWLRVLEGNCVATPATSITNHRQSIISINWDLRYRTPSTFSSYHDRSDCGH